MSILAHGLRAAAGASSLTLSLFDYSYLESTSTSSFTLPSNEAGDLLVFVAQVDSLTDTTTPTGWTLAASSADGGIRKTNIIWYKIAESGDTSLDTNWQYIDAFCLCFRTNSPVDIFQHYDGASQTTTGDPTAQVVSSGSSTGTATLVVGAVFEAGTTNPAFSTFSPAADETITEGIDCSIAYKIYNEGDTPVDHTVDMNDLGNEMSLCSVYFEIGVRVPITEFDFITSTFSSTNASSYTFTDTNIGDADDNRNVVLALASRGDPSNKQINSISIGGITATKIIRSFTDNTFVEYWYAKVPTGTTATISVTMSGNVYRLGVAVYRVIAPSLTLYDSAQDSTGPFNLSVDTPDLSAAVIAIATGNVDATATWSGLTEDCDFKMDSNRIMTTASTFSESENTPLSVTCTFTSYDFLESTSIVLI